MFNSQPPQKPSSQQLPIAQDENNKLNNRVEVQDNFIPLDLSTSLKTNLDKITNAEQEGFLQDDTKKNLINPSLFPYVKGVSMRKDGTIEETEQLDSQKRRRRRCGGGGGRISDEQLEKYQWLPTDFYIDALGQVSIQGYINGCTPRSQHLELYRDIEKVFQCCLPMIENCINKINNEYYDEQLSLKREYSYINLPKEKNTNRQYLRNCTLQVIVRAVSYVLRPGQSYQGQWHVEGTPSEKIIANGIYYYEVSDNIVDQGLQVRGWKPESDKFGVGASESEGGDSLFDNVKPVGASESQRGDSLFGNVKPMDTIDTHQGRCVVFPNYIQHKVKGLSNASDTEAAYRKILVFQIVDPAEKILSTADVTDQNWGAVKVEVVNELQKVAIRLVGKQFPEHVASKIVNSSKVGFFLQEAKVHLSLLRKYRTQLNQRKDQGEQPVRKLD